MQNYPTTDATGAKIPNPSRPLSEGVTANTLIFTADSGHEQRRTKGRSKEFWEVSYTVLTLAQYTAIRNFYLVHLNVTKFKWKHPISKVEKTVRFDGDTFTGENFAHSNDGPLYKLSFKLVEVL